MKETAMESELMCVISGFLCEVSKICVTVSYCRTHSWISLSTFRYDLSYPSSSVWNPRRKWPLSLF